MTALQPSHWDPLRLNRSRPLHFEPLENRRLLAVAPGANLVPKAFPDAAMTNGNTPAIVDVIRNDYDTDGSLDPTTVQVVGRPKAGTVEVRSDGTVSYRPPANRFGVDSFIYTVQDNLGASSNPANVRIEVRSVWQNPSDALDVNGDGGFSPIDILRVLNELNRRGAGRLEHPPQYPVTPPPFVDVTGDGYLTAADALFAINCLNSQSRADSLGYCPLPELPVFTQTHSQDGVPLPSETSAEPPSDPEGPTDPMSRLTRCIRTTIQKTRRVQRAARVRLCLPNRSRKRNRSRLLRSRNPWAVCSPGIQPNWMFMISPGWTISYRYWPKPTAAAAQPMISWNWPSQDWRIHSWTTASTRWDCCRPRRLHGGSVSGVCSFNPRRQRSSLTEDALSHRRCSELRRRAWTGE